METLPTVPGTAAPASTSVLAAVSHLIAEAAPLRDAVSRLASTISPAVPFTRMHLLRLDRIDSVTLFTARASGEIEEESHQITGATRAGLQDSSGATVVQPAGTLDPHARSVMFCQLRHGLRVLGALWFTSTEPDRFRPEHQALVDDLGDLVGLAVLCDSLQSAVAVRRERLESLERLLQTVAGALDIRSVFDDVSNVVQGALPHDVLALTAWASDGRTFRVHALAGASVPDPAFWEPMALVDSGDRAQLNRDEYVVRDAQTEIDPASIRGRLLRRVGARSALRVPLPLQNDVFGSLFFLSREPDHFTEDDVDFARRVGGYVALALSHQRLSEAARRDAEARETAARLEAQVADLRRELEAREGRRRVIGSSQVWKDVLGQAARVAPTETTVLLTGESGTGKEVIARFIHHASRRSSGPFVAINCAALPEPLLESELFGHERGAFTGAVAARPGRVEQANGGVLFLDEIGEMPVSLQAKLLRVLEEREFVRLGGTRLQKADIRVIAATNRDISAAIRRGDFREDLYYRLGVFEIALPPLRTRPEDILELATEFADEIGRTMGRPSVTFTRDARAALVAYHWPGNIRELRNAIERAVILADGGAVRSEHLPFTAPGAPAARVAPSEPVLPPGGIDLESVERSLVVKALAQARHNKSRAARLLGLTRSQLYSRIEKYKLRESEL